MRKIVFLLVVVISFIGCTAKKAVVETVVVETVDMSNFTPELVQGKSIYETKCGICHDLPNNDNYSKEHWLRIMLSMQKEAKISDADRELVYNYVTMNH